MTMPHDSQSTKYRMYSRLYMPDNDETFTFYDHMPLGVCIFVCTGFTDRHMTIDDLVYLVGDCYGLNPRSKSLFCFCDIETDEYRVLFFDGDTYSLATRRLLNRELAWPREPLDQMWKLTRRSFYQLLEGGVISKSNALVAFDRIDGGSSLESFDIY